MTTVWTEIPNATFSSVIAVSGGEVLGLLSAITKSTESVVEVDPWTDVPNAEFVYTFSGGEVLGLLAAITKTTVTVTPAWTNVANASITSWTQIPNGT